MIKLVQRWGDNIGLLQWAQCNHSALIRRRQESQSQRRRYDNIVFPNLRLKPCFIRQGALQSDSADPIHPPGAPSIPPLFWPSDPCFLWTSLVIVLRRPETSSYSQAVLLHFYYYFELMLNFLGLDFVLLPNWIWNVLRMGLMSIIFFFSPQPLARYCAQKEHWIGIC